jgi:hypothetical protein
MKWREHDRSPNGSASADERTGASLAGMLVPLQAHAQGGGDAWSVTIAPASAAEALPLWLLAAGPASHALLVPGDGVGLGALAERWSIPTEATFPAGAIALAPIALCELVTIGQPERFAAVLIDGPIDDGDARAITAAVREGRSPLACELRANLAVRGAGPRVTVVDARERAILATFVGERLRHYVAALRRGRVDEVGGPEPALVERVLERSGMLRVRPIETEVYSTFIDVGISTTVDESAGPADASLIYDLTSRTWHGE